MFSFPFLPMFKSTLTWKMCFRLCSEGIGRHSMLKCRMKRGVTGLRPPPGGAHADAMVTSCPGRNPLGSPNKGKDEVCPSQRQDSDLTIFEDLSFASTALQFPTHRQTWFAQQPQEITIVTAIF